MTGSAPPPSRDDAASKPAAATPAGAKPSTGVPHNPLSLSDAVEATSAWAASQMNILAASFGMVRNFQRAMSLPPARGDDPKVALVDKGEAVQEIERDGRVGVDLKFGSITFREEDGRSLACALIDVLVPSGEEGDTRVQMDVKVAADPETESLVAVTEKCRTRIVATLRAAADTLDATTARALIFEGETKP